MKRLVKPMKRFIFIGLLSVGFISLWYSGLRINRSPSIPPGLYWVSHTRSEAPYSVSGPEISTAPYVLSCLPDSVADWVLDRGYLVVSHTSGRPCHRHHQPLAKMVVRGPGTIVRVDTAGIHIDGLLVANTRPLLQDNAGRMMPGVYYDLALHRALWQEKTYRLKVGEVFLYSNRVAYALDGRYFGPTPERLLIGHLEPLF